MTKNVLDLAGAALVVLLLVLCGCGDGHDHDHDHDHDKKTTTKKDGDGSGEAGEKDEWWCVEHAIPEHLCGMCVKEHADKCKAKGDWCDKHNIPGSNCFACNPDMKEKYAVMYRNKYGKEPPPMEEEGEEGEKKDGDGDEKK